MSNYNSNSSGRRSGRGRGRGRGGRDRDRDRGGDREQEPRGPRGTYPVDTSKSSAPAKLSFFQKIIRFFTGGSKPAPVKERPQYTPRNATRTEGSPKREGRTENRSERSDRFQESEARPPRPARKPEAIEVTTAKIYVGNLSFDATESDLSNLFNGVGVVVTAEIVSHKQTEKSKGFGFVTLSSIDEARRAVDVLHDKDFMGRKLVVSGAKTPVERE
jgi:RNA recognition motif-containing protein